MLKVFERLFEMSKFRLFLTIWTSISMAILVFIVNRSFKPELSISPELISNLNLTRLSTEDSVRLRVQWPQIIRDLNEVHALFQALDIARIFHPIDLKISSQQPLEFKIEPDQIELGIDYALAPGELAHALLENWFIQNKPVRTLSDRLKQMLYADIFWTAAHSKFELGIPESQTRLTISEREIEKSNLQDILFQISSSQNLSESDWAPEESRANRTLTRNEVRERKINPLSLRKFLLIQILKSEMQLSLKAKIEYLKKIAVKTNFSSPEDVDLRTLSHFVNQAFADFEIQTRLDKKSFSVDALFDSPESLKTAIPYSISYILHNSEGYTLFPGNLVVEKNEMRSLFVHTLVFFVQKIAAIQKFENTSFKANKILTIENPRNEFVQFDSLRGSDFNRFAQKNQKIRFAVFDQESLKYAAQKNLINSLARLLESSEPKPLRLADANEALGVTSAHWDSLTQTYRLSGAIEALQMWRPLIQ